MRTHTSDPVKGGINLRISSEDLSLIDSAAKLRGQTRTSFMLEASKQSAEEILLNQTYFFLNGDQWQAFNELLDKPPAPNAKLKKLLQKKSPWE